MILSQICHECKENFGKELKGMVDLIFSNQSQNPRLIWANLTCLAMLAEEYAPDFQLQFTKE